MDEPKVDSKPVSDETKEQKIAAEIADPTLSLKAHSNNFTEHELSKLEVWYKMKTSKTPGVSIVSRLLYGATLELIKSINKKYFNREIVEYLFCSICTSQAAEAQVQKLIKPALGYVMTLRNRRIDAHHHAYSKNNRNVEEQAQIIPSDELLIELSLIKDDFFTIEHVMQIVIEDMHDIGSILLYEYESAFGQMNLQYNS